MLNRLIEKIKEDKANWERFQNLFDEKEIHSKTILLQEGDTATHLHFIKNGCLRMWFNKEGKDITFQFFFESQAVSSVESFITGQPSIFTIESIEPSTIVSISSEDWKQMLQAFPEIKEGFQQMLFQRFRNYAQLFLSRIKDTPRERYEDLVKNHPEIIQRVPQHYIASYLGVTPISLSRIRNRR
jgi:CRP-like cAMP-binding protein